MSEILSQAEIDALLNAMSSGEEVAAESNQIPVTNYDFARPSKFSKEQLRSLEMIFDNYSRVVSSFLTAYLRTTVSMEVVNAEQVTYQEFSNLLVNPVILSIMEFSPLKGSLVLEMSAQIGYSMIDRILGGPGVGMKKLRDFSDLEKILLERVVSQMMSFLPDAWENVQGIQPRLEKIETNAQFAQIIAPNEMTALVTLNISVGGIEGFINFCIPHLVLEPIMDRLNTKNWFSAREHGNIEGEAEILERRLESANIRISASIGKTMIMVSDFVNLQPGDVIPLDSYVNSDLNIYVGNLLKFRAKPGISRGRNAIQITSLIEKEE